MMQLYYVKSDLFGVPAGRVERFADHKAGALVMAGSIEPYDERKHGKAPGAPPAEATRTAELEANIQLATELGAPARKRQR